ncbi:ATP-binding protein, partial [Bacillus pumilus]
PPPFCQPEDRKPHHVEGLVGWEMCIRDRHITAVLSETDEEVRIEMKDNGCGMAQETVDHLFNRYYRGTNTNDPTNGTGLGLALSLIHNLRAHETLYMIWFAVICL